MLERIRNFRNIGISAHVDAGKTTLSERILYYSGVIRQMYDVKGKDNHGAKMDDTELERTKGITISSACTQCHWKDCEVNFIDTPGHVDFTVEVERALRVLDGAVFVFCGVAGVQAQSYTVDRQMKRYKVPGIAFVNKLDTPGADPRRVCRDIREKLERNAFLFQLPLGQEDELRGIVDVLTLKAWEFHGKNSECVVEVAVPEELLQEARLLRSQLWEAAADLNDEIMNCLLEEKPLDEELVQSVLRQAVLDCQLTPVFMGSAFKNKGIQPLLDAICDYLPSPLDQHYQAWQGDSEVMLESNPAEALLAYAFKQEENSFGQLTYLRLYRGTLRKGMTVNVGSEKQRISRLVRMNSRDMLDLDEAIAGDIVAVFGLNCSGGATLWDTSEFRLENMFVAEPLIELKVEVKYREDSDKLAKALRKYQREDPTFKVSVDEVSGETLIAGMGELHLEVYLAKMKLEYGLEVNTGRPMVAYREALTCSCDFDYTLKKQKGGPGMYARIVGRLEPAKEYEFVDEVKGGAIPVEFIKAVNKGFEECIQEGPLEGFPLEGMRVVLTDGDIHSNDSSDRAFRFASHEAYRTFTAVAKPVKLEPVMLVDVETPIEFQGAVIGDLNRRRGRIQENESQGKVSRLRAQVPLVELFAYVSDLRSMTQGKANFSMEFSSYEKVK